MSRLLSVAMLPFAWSDALRARIIRGGALPILAFWVVALLLAGALPAWMNWRFINAQDAESWILDNYVMTVLIKMAIFAIAALGLNIIVGYTGLLNLGFSGFLAIGAYTTGILMKSAGWTFWEAVPVAVLHAALWGVLLGLPTLRLTGDYFAIVTFGFGELVVLAARNWQSLTGGAQGLKDVPRVVVSLPGMDEPMRIIARTGLWPLYAIALGFLALACAACWRLATSRIGRAWFALREDETAAEACGIDTKWYKLLAHACSAAIGGLAGSIFPALNGGVFVSDYGLIVSVYILVYLVFGGMGSITGSVAGAAMMIGMLELLREGIARFNAGGEGLLGTLHDKLVPLMPGANPTLEIDPEIRFIFYGALLILVVRLRPEGLFPNRAIAGELHPETKAAMAQAG